MTTNQTTTRVAALSNAQQRALSLIDTGQYFLGTAFPSARRLDHNPRRHAVIDGRTVGVLMRQGLVRYDWGSHLALTEQGQATLRDVRAARRKEG